jgi:hypothetical protein
VGFGHQAGAGGIDLAEVVLASHLADFALSGQSRFGAIDHDAGFGGRRFGRMDGGETERGEQRQDGEAGTGVHDDVLGGEPGRFRCRQLPAAVPAGLEDARRLC